MSKSSLDRVGVRVTSARQDFPEVVVGISRSPLVEQGLVVSATEKTVSADSNPRLVSLNFGVEEITTGS
jgi:hypothetical protein